MRNLKSHKAENIGNCRALYGAQQSTKRWYISGMGHSVKQSKQARSNQEQQQIHTMQALVLGDAVLDISTQAPSQSQLL